MSNPLIFAQDSFGGGMNQQVDGSRVGANEYPLLVNGRTRNGTVDPVTKPIDRTPTGVTYMQGVYAAGSYSILFASGRAYYRDESVVGSSYNQVVGFLMSPSAKTLFACPVPASTVNSRRALQSGNNVNGGINFTSGDAPSPQCLLVQDGVSQPWVIFPDGTARVTQNYNQWLTTNREYVPIGRQMLLSGGILYIVSADGTQIYRSVSGRPLDFMVIVDANANKLPSEAAGGAAQISHKVDYAPITALVSINSPDGSFYVSTARTSYMVRPNFDVTPYGEPSFDNVFLFSTGAANQFSLCDVLGDMALIDYSGIRSFNAVKQYRVDGKNSPFSARINKLLDGQVQLAPAAVSFDNYALFYVSTVFGNAIMVFDTITQQWSALDLHEELGVYPILMFCEVRTTITRKLLCITRASLFELYSPDGESHIAGYYTPEFSSGDSAIRQKAMFAKMTFVDVLSPGSVFVLPVEDGKRGVQKFSRVTNVSSDALSNTPPVLYGEQDKVRSVTIPLLNTSRTCWKCGLYVRWNFSAKLASVKLISNTETANNAIEQQAAVGADSFEITAISFASNTPAGSSVSLFGVGFSGVTSIVINDFTITSFVIMDDGWIIVTLPADWVPSAVISTIVITSTDSSGGISSFTWSIDPSDDGLGNNSLVLVVPPSVLSNVNSDGSARTTADIVASVNTWIGGAGGSLFALPQTGSFDPSGVAGVQPPMVIVNDPSQTTGGPLDGNVPSGNSQAASCFPISLNSSSSPLSPVNTTLFVLDVSAAYNAAVGGNASFAGLYFTQQSDGSFRFVTPLLNEAGSTQTLYSSTRSLAAMGQSFDGDSGIVVFDLGSFSICVNFGNGAGGAPGPAPEPEPEDPCNGDYPTNLYIQLNSILTDTGAGSMNDPYITLTKSTVNGMARYTGHGGDFTFTDTGGFTCDGTVTLRKDYPGYEGYWVLSVVMDSTYAGWTNNYAYENLLVIDACNPPLIESPALPIGHIEGSITIDAPYVYLAPPP